MKKGNKYSIGFWISIMAFSALSCGKGNLPVSSTDNGDEFFRVNPSIQGLGEIVFLAGHGGLSGNFLYTVNADGSGLAEIGQEKGGTILNFSLSPNEPKVVMSGLIISSDQLNKFDLYELAFESGEASITKLTDLPSENALAADATPVYSADGKQIFFSMTNSTTHNWDIFSYVHNREGLVNITNDIGDENWPLASPDGTKLAYMTSDLNLGWQLTISNIDGTNRIFVAHSIVNSRLQTWSPDGSALAFVADTLDLFTVNADGSGLKKIVSGSAAGGDIFSPSFSPDGSRIAFTLSSTPIMTDTGAVIINGGIYLVDADGENLTRLTFTSTENKHVQWSPDGSKLIFDGYAAGRSDIFVINADGSELSKLSSDDFISNVWPRWVHR